MALDVLDVVVPPPLKEERSRWVDEGMETGRESKWARDEELRTVQQIR